MTKTKIVEPVKSDNNFVKFEYDKKDDEWDCSYSLDHMSLQEQANLVHVLLQFAEQIQHRVYERSFMVCTSVAKAKKSDSLDEASAESVVNNLDMIINASD